MTRKIKIFDTTLRDGEQCPGASLNPEEKMEIARQLAKLNVDVIEAGFAIASQGDFDAIKAIAQQIKGPTICSLARTKKEDIVRAWEAVKNSEKPRIHTFIATSPIHMEKKLRMKPEQVLKQAVEMVKLACSLCPDVEFSPEDAGRSELEFLYKVVGAVIDAGAQTVNIPDTVGYTTPEEFGKLIADIIKNVPQIKEKHVTISVHVHNDLGLAVANSLAAVQTGATQVECTINGIGERAGNASLEEVVLALKTRSDFYDLETNINTKEIYRASRLVVDLTGMSVQPNKAIVGANAFRHQSGIHQDGILKMRETYEIMDAGDLGWPTSGGEIVLGKTSGRAGFKARLQALGYDLSDEELSRAFLAFKELADKNLEVDDRDLEALVADKLRTSDEVYHLDFVQVTCGDHASPTASVRLIAPDGAVMADAALGTGPVDAVYQAINRIVQVPNVLTEFAVKSVTAGIDAQGEVTIRVESDGRTYVGRGSDTDIIVASAKAYMNALNRLIFVQRQPNSESGKKRVDAEVRTNP